MTWVLFFFFNDTATTEIYTLSLHDALPIFVAYGYMMETWTAWYSANTYEEFLMRNRFFGPYAFYYWALIVCNVDRKSTRLNSSHANISYAVFCLKKK